MNLISPLPFSLSAAVFYIDYHLFMIDFFSFLIDPSSTSFKNPPIGVLFSRSVVMPASGLGPCPPNIQI